MRTLAFLALLLLALPGCVGDDGDGEGEETTSSTTTTTTAATNTTTAPPPVNTPPEANLTVDIDNGTAPLAVNFTLNATDLDGDVLNWTFDADGDGVFEANGTSADLPANVTFTYNAPGQWRAVLNVTDGLNATMANLTISVSSGGGSGGGGGEELPWATVDELGQCHAANGFIEEVGPGWIHDRTTLPVPLTGLADPNGGGTWVYEESNGVPGLQLGGPDEDGPYQGCANPDTLVF
jgi:hypothetical protein